MITFWFGVLALVMMVSLINGWRYIKPNQQDSTRVNHWQLPCMLTLFVLAVASLGYLALGSYSQLAQPALAKSITPQHDNITLALLEKIQQNPQQRTWRLQLGQHYLYNNQFSYALATYDQLIEQEGISAEVLAAKATVRYYQNNQRIDADTQGLLTQTLAIEPLQITATMLIASDHFNHARYKQAIKLWQALLDSQDPNIDRAALIEAINMAKRVDYQR